MKDDPIVSEVRHIRDEHAAQYNYDLRTIYAALKEQEKRSQSPTVSRSPKRIRLWRDDYEAAAVLLQVLREETKNSYGQPNEMDQDESASLE